MATYQIAGLNVEMNTFGRTLAQAEPYRVKPCPPELVLRADAAALRRKNPHLSLDDCEYLATGADFYRKLTSFDGVMLHASCVVVDEQAYLFSAPCGVGKSTHTRLWLRLLGPRAYILNDDKPALRILDGTIYAYGTPWSGKDDCSRNARAALGGIAILERGTENEIRPLKPGEAIFPLLNQTARQLSVEAMQRCLETLEKIAESGKIYLLRCNMQLSAAHMAYETMSGRELAQ